MMRMYTSSNDEDAISRITVFGKDALHCLSLAVLFFQRNNFKGRPVRVLFTILSFILFSTYSYSNDTIYIKTNSIERIICDTVSSSKLKVSIKYYAEYNNQLIPTNKLSHDKFKLIKKFGYNNDAIVVVDDKKNKKIFIL